MPPRNNNDDVPRAVAKRRDKVCRHSPTVIRVRSNQGNKNYSLTESCRSAAGHAVSPSRRTLWKNALSDLGGSIPFQPNNFGESIASEPDIGKKGKLAHYYACILDGVIHCKVEKPLNISSSLDDFLLSWNDGEMAHAPPQFKNYTKRFIITILLI